MAASIKSTDPSDILVDAIVDSYKSDDRTHHLNSTFLPSRTKTIQIIEHLRRLIFPGFFDEQRLTSERVSFHVRDLLVLVQAMLREQINEASQYEQSRVGGPLKDDEGEDCEQMAGRLAWTFLETIPCVRHTLATDVQAAFDGDPAAVSTNETIFCYPSLDAVFIYRIAHELYKLRVPLLARIMSEYAHNETGIDIHPGAQIGKSFFIDHGTGVVIGETSEIGNHVQIYQGVTLGAMAPRDGNLWRGRKRHPTIKDHVVIYPNATILGGDTVVGEHCVINGSVVLMYSVPPGHTVRIQYPQPELRPRRSKKKASESNSPARDFQI